LENIYDVLRVKVKGMTTASEVCEYKCLVTNFVFGIMDILSLAATLHQQISCLFYFSHLKYFISHEHTLINLEVIIYFSEAKCMKVWLIGVLGLGKD
jgi:hypothetical protein